MNAQQIDKLAKEFTDLLEEQASLAKPIDDMRPAAQVSLVLPSFGIPKPDIIKQWIEKAMSLGKAVDADSVSISGGFGISIGVSFRLPKKGKRAFYTFE